MFCPACPTVIIDEEQIKRAVGKRKSSFQVIGTEDPRTHQATLFDTYDGHFCLYFRDKKGKTSPLFKYYAPRIGPANEALVPPAPPLSFGSPLGWFFKFAEGPHAGKLFAYVIKVCQAPTCPCPELRFDVHEVLDDGSALNHDGVMDWFDYNVEEEVCHQRPGVPSSAMPEDHVGWSFQKALTKADKELLRSYFSLEKEDQVEAIDPETAHIDFPLELVQKSEMLFFQDVFPAATGHDYFTWNGQHWLWRDMYCLEPGCTCEEVCLYFFPEGGSCNENGAQLPAYSMIFDLQTKTWKSVKPQPGKNLPPPLPVEMQQGDWVRAKDYPALWSKRRTLLRRLFARWLVRQGYAGGTRRSRDRHSALPSVRGSEAWSPREEPHEETIARPITPAPASAEPGRNDPCPCGSGLKYKKCCLGRASPPAAS
ncbi:MAG: hypothetical protein OZSIB_4375 [Candidatus Ozemobacter sibiricus]|uniref:SEC-C motif-containing protein n=1 Tax=Candidatus Ozemobacter sibiricus TaxID=2268124 RepID=A0A367ZA60_9BACT|nr:MAG: hypothetical protein OZSIB_4375 [Candidatus Ozemobacter sibiricus]